MAMADRSTPETPSCDYEAMLPFWQKVDTILEGAEAMRAAGTTYLPQFEGETFERYEVRRQLAKFTNVYADVVSNLAAKPFAEEVQLGAEADERFKALAEDIDGRGNNLHAFSKNVFFSGINRAVDWILVDYTKAKPRADGLPLTIEDEKNQGLRPYWVRVPATEMLAVYSATVAGKTFVTHARMREYSTQRNGFSEVTTEQIRVFDRAPLYNEFGQVVDYGPATFELWQKNVSPRVGRVSWQRVASGPISIGVIPLVPFITGERKGNSWQFIPPLRDAAEVQVEHYQAESRLKWLSELTAYPMLSGNGVQPALDEKGNPKPVPVGPRAVLYAPPIIGQSGATTGEWKWIEPTAENAKFLAAQVEVFDKQIRELGRQPLVASQMTVIQAGMNSSKANAAIKAWALGLKDALEQAMKLTAMWLKAPDAAPTVRVFTDFALEFTDGKDLDALNAARKNGDLSRETLWDELERRGVLSEDFDPEEEAKRLDQEAQDNIAHEADLLAATTPRAPKGPPTDNKPADKQAA